MNILQISRQIIKNIKDYIILTYGISYVVIGEGDINSNILIIGEAMGKEEEKNLRIFIGRSGYILRDCLNKNLISSFFIINTMPIRPKNNRSPTYSEILFFSEYYKKIINLKQFNKIIALGKCASTLLEILNKTDVIKTYHPAYLLYNRYDKNIYSKFNNDICKLRTTKYNYVTEYIVIRSTFMK